MNTVGKKTLRMVALLVASVLCASAAWAGSASMAPVQSSDTVTYFHNDLSGSPLVATNATGAVVWKEYYRPYGERLNGFANMANLKVVPTRKGTSAQGSSSGPPTPTSAGADNALWFAGKPRDGNLGHDYLGARYYDPVTGRFLGVDPAALVPGDPRSFNRYAYAHGNPYRYVDPDGHSPLDVAFLAYDLGKLALAVYGGNGIGHAAVDVALSAVGVISPVVGTGEVLKAARVTERGVQAACGAERAVEAAKGVGAAEKGGLSLFKWGKETTAAPGGWKEGDFMLHLPDKGGAQANWAQNAGRLREQMRQGNPIYDSYRDAVTGQQIPTKGFLAAERNLLESRGWQYKSSTGAYHPPTP